MEIDKFCERELQEMKELCLYMINSFLCGKDSYNDRCSDIYKIALVEINRELEIRQSK